VQVRAITRYDNVDAAALAGCDASLLTSTQIAGPDVLPAQASHANRALGIGPTDGKLYFTVGAPFNVDVCVDPYCSIHRINRDGSGAEVFARGMLLLDGRMLVGRLNT
jgi:glucose/arabinose dehydrogenase